MNFAPNETLEKLMKMPSQAFTIEELRYLINLSVPYPLGFEKNVERIYNRLREVPPEAGGLAGGLFAVMDAIKKNLTDILNDMEVPAMRRELTVHNLKWLARNLHFKNREKDSFPSAIHFITTLLWMQGESSVTIGENNNGPVN